MRENKEKVVVIIGPTAVGKTRTSIEVAKAINGEIISGDSMQVYREMDIGTAKIKEMEMQGVPHHLIDIKEPGESFSVAEFQTLVRAKVTEITNRGKIPIIVGGTGLYIQAAIFDYQFSDSPSNLALRHQLEERVEQIGVEALHQELQLIDPESAKKIHPNNVRRVIRALEVYQETGKTLTQVQEKQELYPVYETAIIGLAMDRERLYERINARVDIMLQEGLLDEVDRLMKLGYKNSQSLQAIGYKEWIGYFDGERDYLATVDLLKQNSRRYAKRQLTWFRNKMNVNWFDMTEVTTEQQLQKKIKEIYDYIEGKLQIRANTYE